MISLHALRDTKERQGFLPFLLLSSRYLRGWGGLALIGSKSPTSAGLMQNKERVLSVVSCFGLGVSCIVSRHAVLAPTSGYICPASSYLYTFAPGIELLNLMLLCCLIRAMEDVVWSSGRVSGIQRDGLFFDGIGYLLIVR